MRFLESIHEKARFCFSYRSLCSNVSNSLMKREPFRLKFLPKSKRGEDVLKYLRSYEAEHIYRKIPVGYFAKISSFKHLLINPFIAKKIAKALKLYLKDSYVLESDPGIGLLSKEMINAVSYLRVYEEDINFRAHLRELQNKRKRKMEIFDSSLLSIQKLQLLDSLDGGCRMGLLFGDIPSDMKINIIMMASYKKLVASWENHILTKSYFSRFKDLDFYFFIPPSIYTRMVASPQNGYWPRYQKFSVLSQLMFDIELLINDLPRTAFLPWPSKPRQKQKKRDVEKYENDYEVVFLVRMSLKHDRLTYLQDENMFSCFVSFVSESMIGNRRLVPYLETIIPGSGSRAILLGHNIYSTFKELNPDEIFDLFLELSKWPEFKNTSFFSSWKNNTTLKDEMFRNKQIYASQDDLNDVHDEDDNDDDAFLPGNTVK